VTSVKAKLEWANTVLYRAWGEEDIDAEADIDALLVEVERLQVSEGDYKLAADQNYAGYELMQRENERLRAALTKIALSYAAFPEKDIAEDALDWHAETA
jgi:hypothetical protein